jgi:hypothetical protein
MTDNMKHDCKIIAILLYCILYTVKQYMQIAPEKVFVIPYRKNDQVPLHHSKAASVCAETIQSAISTIDTTIINTILVPFCHTLNRLIATNVLSKIHQDINASKRNVFDNSHIQ